MGEAVGLFRLMPNSSEAKWANELKIKDQGRTSQETKEQRSRIRDKKQKQKQKHTKERTSRKDDSRYDRTIHPRHQNPHTQSSTIPCPATQRQSESQFTGRSNPTLTLIVQP